jgi:tricorn protease
MPDSKQIMIRANRTEFGERQGKYFLVNLDGGLETPLQIVNGGFAVLSPDAKKICFTPVDREFRTWKRYKGGRATDLWIYDLENNTRNKSPISLAATNGRFGMATIFILLPTATCA